MGSLPEGQGEFDEALSKLLDQAIPPNPDASLPTHIMYMRNLFANEGFTQSEALYCAWAVVLQNPGPAPR